MVFHQLAALGATLPYGTLSPCWCANVMENRTSFHDAYTQPTQAGFGPASSGSAAATTDPPCVT